MAKRGLIAEHKRTAWLRVIALIGVPATRSAGGLLPDRWASAHHQGAWGLRGAVGSSSGANTRRLWLQSGRKRGFGVAKTGVKKTLRFRVIKVRKVRLKWRKLSIRHILQRLSLCDYVSIAKRNHHV